MTTPEPLSAGRRRAMLAAAFLGWMFAGVEMSLLPMAARAAILDFLGRPEAAPEALVGRWFSWYIVAFLLGAAAGGAIFGWIGDRWGRVRSMGWSILCYSVVTGASFWAATLEQLLVLRFVACLGVGGMWPSGVSLISEAWPEASKPRVAGVLGAAANLGIFFMGLLGASLEVTPESWRWVLAAGAAPAPLGLLVLAALPESPAWLAFRSRPGGLSRASVFRPPLLRRTLVGIALATIPLLGAWGSSKWLLPWADQARGTSAVTQTLWAAGATIGSFSGGWIAGALGRRRSYFLISLASLVCSGVIYRFLSPVAPAFLPAVFLLGAVSTTYFGWLPLFLPELFPVQARATGTGVTYNFGRILTAAGVLGAGTLMTTFSGDYARVGTVVSLAYALGMLVIWLAPGREAGASSASDPR